jgi:transcriptional regulator with XRE-family HTH domain
MARRSTQQKLGIRVRELRNQRGWTQEKLEELSGLDRTYISDIERGVRNPSVTSLDKLAKALKVKAAELLKDL